MDEGVSRDAFRAVADRVELTELLSRYHQAIDDRDWEALRRVFTTDAVTEYVGQAELFDLEVGTDVVEGLDAIIDWLRRSLTMPRGEIMHYMTNHVFDIDGDTARTRSYYHAQGVEAYGIYEVDHVRTRDGWRIRRLSLEQRYGEGAVERLMQLKQSS